MFPANADRAIQSPARPCSQQAASVPSGRRQVAFCSVPPSMRPRRAAAADFRRYQKTEWNHQERDDPAIIEHIRIGQHRRLEPVCLIDAADSDVMCRAAYPAHGAQRLFVTCDQSLIGLMERTRPLREVSLVNLRALRNLRG